MHILCTEGSTPSLSAINLTNSLVGKATDFVPCKKTIIDVLSTNNKTHTANLLYRRLQVRILWKPCGFLAELVYALD